MCEFISGHRVITCKGCVFSSESVIYRVLEQPLRWGGDQEIINLFIPLSSVDCFSRFLPEVESVYEL